MRRIHPIVRDFCITAITQGGVFASTLLVVAIVGRLLGSTQLTEYLLLRRVLGWFMSGGLLGLGIALPRYIAISYGRSGPDTQSYFLAGTVILASVGVGAALVLNAFSAFFAALLFGSSSLTSLIFPLSIAILAWEVQGAVYGYYRGMSQMRQANALQLINMAVVPLVSVVLLRRTSIESIMVAIAVANLLSALLFGAPVIARVTSSSVREVRRRGAEMLRYGLPRVVGDFAAGGNAALGPVIAAHFVSIAAIAPLLLGMSITTAVSMSVAPIGLVLLSRFSMAVAQNQAQRMGEHITQLMAAMVQVSTFVCLQVAVFADVIVRTWVGRNIPQNLLVIRLIIYSMPCYLFWVALRSAIDAASVYAYNSRNTLLSLGVFCAGAVIVIGVVNRALIVEGIAAALLVSNAALSVLTMLTIRKLYAVRLQIKSSLVPITAAGAFGVMSLFIHKVSGLTQSFFGVAVCMLLMACLFFLFLWVYRSPWLAHFKNMAFQFKSSKVVEFQAREA